LGGVINDDDKEKTKIEGDTNMTSILVIYASDYGNTEKMAQAATDAIAALADTTVIMKKAEDVTADDFTGSDGVLIGTPVHMGSMDWRIKKMIDTVCSGLWMQDKLNGKVVGVFASGGGFGGAGGGVELTFLAMLNNFAELGMIFVPLPKMIEGYKKGGLQWGPYGRSADEDMNHGGVSEEVLTLTGKHGVHLARAAKALKEADIFA
jgi:NAD(P)H dehydrogenase (quinone)